MQFWKKIFFILFYKNEIFVILKKFDLLDLNIFDLLAKPKYFQGRA